MAGPGSRIKMEGEAGNWGHSPGGGCMVGPHRRQEPLALAFPIILCPSPHSPQIGVC